MLAGCAGNESDPAESEPGVNVITEPGDFSYLNGSRPDQREHLHDYWRGQDRVLLMEETQNGGARLCNDGHVVLEFLPPDDATVYQGTQFVEVTTTWTDGLLDSHDAPQLWIKTAADVEPVAVQEIAAGETVTFISSNEQNDLPHQRLSSWVFGFFLKDDTDGCYEFTGAATVRVEIVRGLDIPLYPGHPDRWNGQDEMVLLDGPHSVVINYGPGEYGSACMAPVSGSRCLWAPHRPDDGLVVPFDARTVEVVVETSDPAAFALDFGYHGATTREVSWPEPVEQQRDRAVYHIDVGAGGDGPYAKQSQWEFWLVPQNEVYSGDYSITATAHRASLG